MNPFRSLFLGLSRTPPILMLFIIMGLAVVVTMYVMELINDANHQVQLAQNQANAVANAKTKVVYATKNIDEGELISQEALEERDVPSGKAPVDAYNSVNGVLGQQAAYPIPAGTIVATHALKQGRFDATVEAKIHDGMRALTFGVDTNSGVAGFIAPGSRVDVVAIAGSAGDTKAVAVMSDVDVIAVGTTYQRAPGSSVANPAGSVTVSVLPDDALKLIRSSAAAKLYLTLRSDKDHTPIAVSDVKSLFPKATFDNAIAAGIPAPTPILPPPNLTESDKGLFAPNTTPTPPPVHEVDAWSGGRKEVLSIPQG